MKPLYTIWEAITIIRHTHTPEDLDEVMHQLYPIAKQYQPFDFMLISKALQYKFKTLNNINS
ncbi:hypothetical protein Oweho_3232 [Owenweeksia hongkongensis DSM 17368]|uniref:Uncharacterized protein n=1 Tax=Owenweeksia hongkongensis (strain DSM 17368 / CIP 108786 / JCM 12287 / NRRL B-23963 / UST20020801) TaxID=926562 RepID=G8R3U6_OWEHD|nr:hypothetical protein [Owenweeksia hongkongensis]AEV34183.1 hypothetical protein Oweho_3232 [Owenweeksia hongkongensis DSM 17368]